MFGDDIFVRVAGIDTPELKGSSYEVKAFACKAKNRTQKLLSDAKTVELWKPQRGKYFRVLAEVWVGVWIHWYEHGQQRDEIFYKGGYMESAIVRKPDSKKCSMTD